MEKSFDVVRFKTLDGVYICGRLYAAAQKGPAVILTPGYNCTKDNFPLGAPEEFQRAGITAFVYDPRSTGKSGGFPRNDIDPFKQTEDYSDAFTYLSNLPVVDARAIVFWGISMSAGIALSAAAVDRRIAAVIAIAPIFKFVPVTAADAQRLKTKLMKDRESQMLHGNPPYMLPIGESLAQMPFNSHVNVNQDLEEQERKAKEDEERRQREEAESGEDLDPALTHNPNGTTIQSYHRMFLFEPVPKAMVQAVAPTPVMFLTPELDTISPPDQQKEVFNSLRGPKRLQIAPGKDHIYVLHGPTMPMLMKWQIDFVWQVVRGHLKGDTKRVSQVKAIQPNGIYGAPKQESNGVYA